MSAIVVPAAANEFLLSFQYGGDDGLAWCEMWENDLVGWVVDDEDPQIEAVPRIVGAMPLVAPAAAPVLSPQWGWSSRHPRS